MRGSLGLRGFPDYFSVVAGRGVKNLNGIIEVAKPLSFGSQAAAVYTRLAALFRLRRRKRKISSPHYCWNW